MTNEQYNIQDTTRVQDKEGRQYHIHLAPNEVAPYIIIVGDPNRAAKAANYLTSISVTQKNREFWSFTGKYHETPVTILSTGIGTDNVEIVMVELAQIIQKPTIIRVGSCGAIQPYIDVGEFVISTGAVRLENTSLFFVENGYPAIAHYEVILALTEVCEQLGLAYHVGLTASASGFYGAQGRNILGFPLRYPDLLAQLQDRNVLNFEMESSTLFTLGSLQGIRTSTICAVYANRPNNKFITSQLKHESEKRCIQAGLESCKILHRMDKVKESNQARNWYLSLHL